MREHACGTGDGTEDLIVGDKLIRHDDVADTLARQGERLAVGVADQRVLVIPRDVGNGIALEADFTVRLIGDQEDWMAELLLLRAQDVSQLLDRRLGIHRAARIVRRVHDDGLRMARDELLEGVKVYLPILGAGRYDDELAADRLHKAAVLGEERRKGDVLIALLAQCLEADRDGGSRAGCHEDIPACIVHAEALVDALSHGLTHLRRTRCHRIAMHSTRLPGRQDIQCGLLDEFRRRHVRIAEAEVKDLILTHFRGPLAAKLENRADRRLLRAQLIHLL